MSSEFAASVNVKKLFYIYHGLFREHPSVSARVRHTRAAAAVQPLEFEVSRCWLWQGVPIGKVFPAGRDSNVEWPSLYTVFDTGTPCGFNGAVNRWFSLSCVLPRSRGAGASGVVKAIYQRLCFSLESKCPLNIFSVYAKGIILNFVIWSMQGW